MSWFNEHCYRNDWHAIYEVRKQCPATMFQIEDSDGQLIEAKTTIEEREYLFGEGWFKWLSLFRKPRVYRKLDIEFASEVGRDKGSWKGGVMGDSIELLPNETPEDAFRRYCEQNHHSKNGSYRIKCIGRVAENVKSTEKGDCIADLSADVK